MADLVPQKNKWVLTEACFNKLLVWLDPDPGRAGQRYEEIRRSLILFFESRGCLTAEDQADETIDRVTRRIAEGVEVQTDNPFLYFYGVAVRVFLEYTRTQQRQRQQQPPPPPEEAGLLEVRLRCMEQCLEGLPAETRAMLTTYCQGDHRARTENRKRLATEMGISLNTLRIRVHRLREQLESCVARCMKSSALD